MTELLHLDDDHTPDLCAKRGCSPKDEHGPGYHYDEAGYCLGCGGCGDPDCCGPCDCAFDA